MEEDAKAISSPSLIVGNLITLQVIIKIGSE